MIADYESGKAPHFELYALELEHKHIPEIVAYAGLTRRPIFVPSVGNFAQGMLVSIPLFLDDLPGHPKARGFDCGTGQALCARALLSASLQPDSPRSDRAAIA